MRIGTAALLLPLLVLAGCGGPSLETRTFDLHHIDPGDAEQMVKPYVYTDRPDAPGRLSTSRNTISVRETHDNLERIARVLSEHDVPVANVRLVFQIIRADGAAAPDSAIAPIEAQLRRLFRFRGYQLVAQGVTVATGGNIMQRFEGPGGPYLVRGIVEVVRVRGDSGTVQLSVGLAAGGTGLLDTRVIIGMGQIAVIGGQPGGQPGAVILAVRPEVVR